MENATLQRPIYANVSKPKPALKIPDSSFRLAQARLRTIHKIAGFAPYEQVNDGAAPVNISSIAISPAAYSFA